MHQVVMVLHSLEVRSQFYIQNWIMKDYGIEDPRLITIDKKNYVTYVVLSDYVKNNPSVSTALAKTEDFSHYERLGIVTLPGSQDKDVVLFPRDVMQKVNFNDICFYTDRVPG